MKLLNVVVSYVNMKRIYPHKHDFWELILNTKGEGQNRMGDKEDTFSPGTIFICPPGTYHLKTASTDSFQDIFIEFDDKNAFHNISKYKYEDSYDKKVQKLLLMINDIYHKKEKGYGQISDLLTETVCQILMNQADLPREYTCVAMLKSEILRQFTNPDFHISTAMDSINYCNDYIRRLFKEEMGITPIEYLTKMRIDYAKKLLREGTYPTYQIRDVAYMCGFYDAEYFSKLFRKLEGVSPTRY